MKVKLLEPIEGYEDVAEYRKIAPSECNHFTMDGKQVVFGASAREVFVLTPKQQWRPATVHDVVDVVSGLEVKARFRDDAAHEWLVSRLIGVESIEGVTRFASGSRTFWRYCEVLR